MTATWFAPFLALVLIAGSAWTMPLIQRPTLPFGVRVPAQRVGDAAITAQVRSFRLRVATAGVLGVLSTVALAAWFGAEADENAAALLSAGPMVGLLLLVGLFYLRARRAILRVKTQDRWYGAVNQRITVDTSLRTGPERFPWLWALPALLTVLSTLAVGIVLYPDMPDRVPMRTTGFEVHAWQDKSPWAVGLPVAVELLITAVIVGLLTWSYRSRADLEPSAPARSAFQHRVFLRRLGRALLVFAALMNVALLFAFVPIWQGRAPGPGATAGILLFTMLATVPLVVVAVRIGQGGSRLGSAEPALERPDATHLDDDRHWKLAGFWYVNRNDPAILVQKRVGLGWTLNFGNPRSLLPVVAILAVVAALVLASG